MKGIFQAISPIRNRMTDKKMMSLILPKGKEFYVNKVTIILQSR